MSPERQAWDLENAIVHSAAHAAREMVTACVPTSGAGLKLCHRDFGSEGPERFGTAPGNRIFVGNADYKTFFAF